MSELVNEYSNEPSNSEIPPDFSESVRIFFHPYRIIFNNLKYFSSDGNARREE